MAKEKKTRFAFTDEELAEIYAGLGARAGMIRDMAAFQDMKPSEYKAKVQFVQALQDRIFTAYHGNGEAAEDAPQPVQQQLTTGGSFEGKDARLGSQAETHGNPSRKGKESSPAQRGTGIGGPAEGAQ